MSEELVNNEVKKVEEAQLEKVKASLSNVLNKKSKVLFCIPESNAPAVSIYEVYFQATTVKNLGYDVKILTEKGDYVKPTWIEPELMNFEYYSMEKANLTVSAEDILVIPEIFSNVMEQTKNLPCLRVALLQSIDYMINSLIPGVDWSSFGVQKIITTSEALKGLVHEYYGNGKFDVKVYNVGIPAYFHRTLEPQKPVISIVGRNANEISKVVKLFYARYPQYSWVTFDTMVTQSKPPQPLRRVDFAERLRKNFAGVWIDRIASWGTFPLECMASGTIPIAIKPDITPEYLLSVSEEGKKEYAVNTGVWTDDIYTLPILIGDVVTKFLDDAIGEEIYESMSKIAAKYTQESSSKQIEEVYSSLFAERAQLFEKAIADFEAKLKQ
jgi:hypothetical protein